MPGRLTGYANHMDIAFDRLPGRFLGGLEQGADIHIEADIGERGGDDFGTTIMPVLAHFNHQHTRPPTFVFSKLRDILLDAGKPVVGIGMQPEQVANIACLVRKGFAIRVPKSKNPGPDRKAHV